MVKIHMHKGEHVSTLDVEWQQEKCHISKLLSYFINAQQEVSNVQDTIKPVIIISYQVVFCHR